MIKVASWNINSVRLRAPLVAQFLRKFRPDILTLQETKCPEGQFPAKAFSEVGYSHFAERGQSGHHGVAIVSRLPFKSTHSRQFCAKDDARHVSATIDYKQPFTIHSLYVPAGGDIPNAQENEKFSHKLAFLGEMASYFKPGAPGHKGPTILTGDLNVAPHENDVWSHRQLLKVVSHTPQEVELLEAARISAQMDDVLRSFANDNDKLYSWWSYRSRDWRKSNRGRRLDHIWLNNQLSAKCTNTEIVTDARDWEKPSDHVPVMVEIDI